MSNTFEALKNNRKNSFEKLTTELSKLNDKNQTNREDERFWKPEVDKAGNGHAVIRFLPAPAGEDVPFIRIWDHGFQGPGGWYIEKSLTTLGKPDPVSEHNTELWATGIEANKEIVRKQKRRLQYYSNILVVSDPNRPQNEGKVFLYKYGQKIFDKLNEAMHPEFPDMEKMNPFDMWEGANFKLRIRKVNGYPNYDKSEFDSTSPISKSDEKIEVVWNNCYSLQELLDPKHFKSYDELKTRLLKAIGQGHTVQHHHDDEVDLGEEIPTTFKTMSPKQQPEWNSPKTGGHQSWDEDDDDMSYFKKLAKD